MKKLLLLSGFLLGTYFSGTAQEIWSDNFDDEDISDWEIIDADGDGRNWGDTFIVTGTGGVPVTPVSLISRSWASVPLTPDNWAISPAINLTSASGIITLNWVVQAAAATWSEENYTVYASTENTTDALEASPITFTEIYPGGTSGASLSRTLDLSSFAGETIHIAFRHHDTSDMDFLSIDDLVITGTLSTVNFFANNFAIYPNPTSNVINLNSSSALINNVVLTDLNGRIVKTLALGGVAQSKINMADLTTGVYFLKVSSNLGTGTTKVVKN